MMLMTITLLKDHDAGPDGYFKAGETIEVTEQMYDWLQGIYLADKLKAQDELKAADEKKRKTK